MKSFLLIMTLVCWALALANLAFVFVGDIPVVSGISAVHTATAGCFCFYVYRREFC